VFAAGRKSAKPVAMQPAKPMSEAERIMKDELDRKRARNGGMGPSAKRIRM